MIRVERCLLDALLAFFLCTEEVAQPIKVFLHDNTYTLCVQTGAREVAVVSLIVDLEC